MNKKGFGLPQRIGKKQPKIRAENLFLSYLFHIFAVFPLFRGGRSPFFYLFFSYFWPEAQNLSVASEWGLNPRGMGCWGKAFEDKDRMHTKGVMRQHAFSRLLCRRF